VVLLLVVPLAPAADRISPTGIDGAVLVHGDRPAPPGERVAARVGIFLDAMPARNLGPANMGGRIVDLSVSEINPKIIFVAAATGGVWKTVNGGDPGAPVFEGEAPGC